MTGLSEGTNAYDRIKNALRRALSGRQLRSRTGENRSRPTFRKSRGHLRCWGVADYYVTPSGFFCHHALHQGMNADTAIQAD